MKIKVVLFTACFFAVVAVNGQTSWTDQRPTNANAFHNFTVYSYNTALNGTFIGFNKEDNTRGKKYLFDSWAKGTVVDINKNVIANDSLGYNFDKMQNILIVKMSDKIIQVNKPDIKIACFNN